MLKKHLFAAALASAFALPAFGADGSPYTLTGNVGFVSDYVFNGISQNYRTPALQGGFDLAHSSGLYLGTWASSISGNQYTNASMEWDVYGGYNGKIDDDLGYNVGLMQVFYPGGKAYNTTPDVSKRWDTTEVILGATWKGLNLKYTRTLTDWYGINTNGFTPKMWADGSSTADGAGNLDSKGSGYVEVNYSYQLAENWVLAAHAGHQTLRNFSKLSYTDYKLGVTKAYEGFNLGLAYTTTNATDNTLYHVALNGDDKKLSGSILALSVTRSF